MANKTLSEIYGIAQDLLDFEGDTVGIPGLEEDRTKQLADVLQRQFFDRFRDQARKLPKYMEKEKGYVAQGATTLSSDIVAGAATLTVGDGTLLDSSGAATMFESGSFDNFTFSLNTAGVLTGVSGIDFDHESGVSVQRLYKLPSDFGEFRPEPRFGDGVTVNGLELFETPVSPWGGRFSLWQSGAEKYLWLPQNLSSGNVQVLYYSAPTAITASDTELSITDPDYMYVVYGLLAFFKQTLDEDYVPQKEIAQMNDVLRLAVNRRTVNKPLHAGDQYFDRSHDSEEYPSWLHG